jgi:hypothetical protein
VFKFELQPASDIHQARIGRTPKGLKAPKDATAPISSLEIGKLKRENQALLEIIGRLTVELSAEKKRRLWTSLMPGLKRRKVTKKEVARSLGFARSTTIQNCRRKIGTLKSASKKCSISIPPMATSA